MTQRRSTALGSSAGATFILGGQSAEGPPALLVSPEGNFIRASVDRPVLQIGEREYGKFLLDVAILADVDLVTWPSSRMRRCRSSPPPSRAAP